MEEHCKISSSQWMMAGPWKGKVRFYANRHLACGANRNVSIPTCLTSCRRKIDIVLPLVEVNEPRSEREDVRSRDCDSNIDGNIIFFFHRDFVDDFDIESVRWNVGIIVQVAHALHCPTTTDSDLAICLRGQDVDTLLNVKIHKPSYVPAFAPLIDNAVIPDKPYNLMKNPQMFDRYIAGYMLRQIVYLLLDEKLF